MRGEQGYRGAAARRMRKPPADYDPEAEYEADQANIPDEELPEVGHIRMGGGDTRAAQNIYGAISKRKPQEQEE